MQWHVTSADNGDWWLPIILQAASHKTQKGLGSPETEGPRVPIS